MNADNLLGDEYKNKYEEYYAQGASKKREIAAADTYSHIKALVGSTRFNRVIDVGAGEGSLLARLEKEDFCEQLYAVEISGSGVDAIKARKLARLADAVPFDGYKIPYPDKHFDLALSVHVLEHVEHERLLLREMKRVARQVFIEVPLDNGFNIEKAIAVGLPYGHINYYTPATFLNLVKTAGLVPVRSKVTISSLQYEQFVSGKAKGLVKNLVRKGGLSVAPRAAPWFFGTLMTVFCEG